MRFYLLLSLMVFATSTVDAQFRKIPADVTDAFKARYPHAERVSWKDQLNSFEAQFTLNDHEMSAHFNSEGEWLKSERKLKFEDLPQAIRDGFSKSKYTDWEKVSVYEIARNLESLQYRILVKKSGVQKKYLFFDINGRLNKESYTL